MVNYSSAPNGKPLFVTQESPSPPPELRWLDGRFTEVVERLAALEASISAIEERVSGENPVANASVDREFYSVQEFAELVGRKEYTVREWCRFSRINAEKCESGHGEAKNWKIPVDELQRYRDHGLLPNSYPG